MVAHCTGRTGRTGRTRHHTHTRKQTFFALRTLRIPRFVVLDGILQVLGVLLVHVRRRRYPKPRAHLQEALREHDLRLGRRDLRKNHHVLALRPVRRGADAVERRERDAVDGAKHLEEVPPRRRRVLLDKLYSQVKVDEEHHRRGRERLDEVLLARPHQAQEPRDLRGLVGDERKVHGAALELLDVLDPAAVVELYRSEWVMC
mmetsp:Transcript_20221/g.61344  ORF Transcript_20221/g.61344 Transcript_20221/m.61344 type:complete len:203 (+) Transcript_20221:2064-2672(+)